MSGGAKPIKYTYTVSGKTEAAVRRIYGTGADKVIEDLLEGKVIGKGPHTFKADKAAVVSQKSKKPVKKAAKENATTSKASETGDDKAK